MHSNITIVVVSGMDQVEGTKCGGVPQDALLFGKPVPFSKLLAVAEGIDDRKKDTSAFLRR